MIYIVGDSQDVQAVMRERPLADLAKVKQISEPDQWNGIHIYSQDEVIFGRYQRQRMGWWEEMRDAIQLAEEKGKYEEAQ